MAGAISERLVLTRLATAEDVATIHQGLHLIAGALHLEAKIISTPEDIRKHGFGDHPLFTALIAEVDGAFAGMSLFFASFSTWRGEPGAYIQDFVVAEAYRGQGVAEALLRETAAYAKAEMGARYLRLAVDTDNHRARRFYEGMGLAWSRSEAIHAAYGASFEALAERRPSVGSHD